MVMVSIGSLNIKISFAIAITEIFSLLTESPLQASRPRVDVINKCHCSIAASLSHIAPGP